MQVLAAVTALSTEAIAKGVLNVPEEDEDESEREAMDWTAVAQGTGLNFARESTALTLQRAAERVAKPRVRHPLHPAEIPRLLGDKLPVLAKPLAQRPVPQGPVAASACTSQVSPAAHREMIKHLPKMARRHYLSAAADSGSKWRAGAPTSLAVLRRPSMAKGLARSRPTRPPTAPQRPTPLCLGLPA